MTNKVINAMHTVQLYGYISFDGQIRHPIPSTVVTNELELLLII